MGYCLYKGIGTMHVFAPSYPWQTLPACIRYGF
jgi:hypothetical protein